MTEQQNLREELFPDGMPEPEDFIRALAEYILEQRWEASERSETEAK